MMKKNPIIPVIRFQPKGMYDIPNALGADIPLFPDDLEPICSLILEAIPLKKFPGKKRPEIRFKLVNRLTTRTNGRIGPRVDLKTNKPYFLMTLFRPGLTVKTIIHELAHVVPYWHPSHNEDFFYTQQKLQDIWFGEPQFAVDIEKKLQLKRGKVVTTL